MMSSQTTTVASFIPACCPVRRLGLFCLWLLIAIVSCGERPQVRLHFREEELAELDSVELWLLDAEGKQLAVPDENPVPITRLSGLPSLYFNQEVRLPLDVSVRFVGRTSGNCMVTEGETAKVRIGEMGQVIEVPLSFSPRLELKQRSEAPPRPGKLAFSVLLESSASGGMNPNSALCKSKSRSDTYYVRKSSKVRVEVSAVDSFTVFDGWDDQECPNVGECSLQRTQPIYEDTTWTAKFASWNCMQPDTFCELYPPPKRYSSAIDSNSAMSAWVSENREIWIVGHYGNPDRPTPDYPNRIPPGEGIIMRWTGANWIHEGKEIRERKELTKKLSDIGSQSSKQEIVVVGDDGVFSRSDGEWIKESISISAGGVWVGSQDGVWVVGSGGIPKRPMIWHRKLRDTKNWIPIGASIIETDPIVMKNSDANFHSVTGNDKGELIVSGIYGLLYRSSIDPRVVLKISTNDYARVYSTGWYADGSSFMAASRTHFFIDNRSDMTTTEILQATQGEVFDTWINYNSDTVKRKIWMTGSFGFVTRCDTDAKSLSNCEDMEERRYRSHSMRRIVGNDLEYLWLVGYERDGRAKVKLQRYCPMTICSQW